MDSPLVSLSTSWARLAATRIAQNKLKCFAYLLLAYLCASLASHLLGDKYDFSQQKAKGPPAARPPRQAPNLGAQQQQVDPYANRPRIETKNGHLILQASQDKNIDFKTSGSRGTITVNGYKLDQLIGVARAFDKSSRGVNSMKSVNATDQDQLGPSGSSIQERYEMMLSSILGAANKIENLSAILKLLKESQNEASAEGQRLRRKFKEQSKRVRNLRKELDAITKKLSRNDCLDKVTGEPVCANGATCVDQYDSYKCLCSDQWEGERCDLDVDECARLKGTDLGCQNGGKCVNTQGGYRCECPVQFHGIHCTEQHNDCSLSSSAAMCGHGKCVNLARTQADQPAFECICDQGWTTDGKSPGCLVDVNECLAGLNASMSGSSSLDIVSWDDPYLAAHQSTTSGLDYPCSQIPFVPCINLPGSFRCGACPPGYQGNGRVCRDIDECLDNNGGCSRSPHVECINLPGRRKCGPCPPGYKTDNDGLTCSRVSACEREHNGGCSPNARCVEVAGAANPDAARLCICEFPFVGPGVGPLGCFYLDSNSPSSDGWGGIGALGNGSAANDSSNVARIVGIDFYDANRITPPIRITTNEDACNPNPCQNGGRCLVEQKGDQNRNTFAHECICPAQWTGYNCLEANTFKCGGRLASTSQGVFEFPLGGSYAGLVSDALFQRLQRGEQVDTIGASLNKPRQYRCSWSVDMPVGMAVRLAFGNMSSRAQNKRVASFVYITPNGTEKVPSQLNPPSCSEQLDIRERLDLGNDNDIEYANARERLLGRICVVGDNSGHHPQQLPSGSNVTINSEASGVELKYSFTARPGEHFKPTLAFHLNYTKIDPPCGGPIPVGDSGSVSSPNFPKSYPAGIECRYLLRASPNKRIRIQIGELRLLFSTREFSSSAEAIAAKNCADSLTILDGAIGVDRTVLFQYCENQMENYAARGSSTSSNSINAGQPIISSSSTVEVILVSRRDSHEGPILSAKQKNGFYLTYESEPAEPNCSGLYTAKSAVIKSADYQEASISSNDLSNDNSALAYEFAHYFDFKSQTVLAHGVEELITPVSFKEESSTLRGWKNKAQKNSTRNAADVNAKNRCEYEIRPSNQARNHHVQLDWIELPCDWSGDSMVSLARWTRFFRCRKARLMIFNGKPVRGDSAGGEHSNLVATFCAGDKYNSSLAQLKPLISEGHVLYLVYETQSTETTSSSSTKSEAAGFRLSYRTVCHAVYTQREAQIQTDLDQDVRECVYHFRLPPDFTLNFVVEPYLLSAQQVADNKDLRLPDGSCGVQAVIMDGAVPRGPLGLAQTERKLRTFALDGALIENDLSTAAPAAGAGAEPIDDEDLSKSGSRATPSRNSNLGVSDPIKLTSNSYPSRTSYWQLGSSQAHDIKEFDVCTLPSLGINSNWNELSIMFRLSPKLPIYILGHTTDDNIAPKFVIKYQSEAACGGIISATNGSIDIGKSGAARPVNVDAPTSGEVPTVGGASPSAQCAWVLRNPRANQPISLGFEGVPRDEIMKQRSEWIKWLRSEATKKRTTNTTSTTAKPKKVVMLEDMILDIPDASSSGPPSTEETAASRLIQTTTNCSQVFGEMIEFYEPSAGRTRIICPDELVDESPLHWTTLSDTVHVRLINKSDVDNGVKRWPGRRPLRNIGQLKLTYAMQASSAFTRGSRKNFIRGNTDDSELKDSRNVCGGKLLQSSGTIQTPRHPFNYPPSLTCVWIIQSPDNGQQIRLNFSDFHLEDTNDCYFDYLEIRSGPSSSSPLMGRFCGKQLDSRVIISQSSIVRLMFSSDPNLNKPGFLLNFDAAQTGCGGRLTAASGQIDSPNYPYAFAQSADCEWNIEVSESNRIVLVVKDLDLSGGGGDGTTGGTKESPDQAKAPKTAVCRVEGPTADYLEIIDETSPPRSLGRFCHLSQLSSAILRSSGNKLRVIYRSQAQDRGRGFRLDYVTSCVYEQELEGLGGVIETPGFMSSLGWSGTRDCTWVVRAPLGSNLSVSIVAYNGQSHLFHQSQLDNLIGVFTDEEGNSASDSLKPTKLSQSHATTRKPPWAKIKLYKDITDTCSVVESKVRFWSGRVVDPKVAAWERLEPIDPHFMQMFERKQILEPIMTTYYDRKRSIYNFTLERFLCSEQHFNAQPESWRTFQLTGGANILVVNRRYGDRSFRIEWRAHSPCGGQITRANNQLLFDGVRFDQRLNLSSQAASQPVECIWSISSDSPRMEIDLNADMRTPGDYSNGAASTVGAPACNQSSLRVYDGLSFKSPLIYENCQRSQFDDVVGSRGQLLLRYFSAGLPLSATTGSLTGHSFLFYGFLIRKDNCWQNSYGVFTPYRQLAGHRTSPNYPAQYDAKVYRCSHMIAATFNGRIRYTIDELDIPANDESSADSTDSASSEFADSNGGFLKSDACQKSGNYLRFRDRLGESSAYCGRFDRTTGLGVAVGDTLARSVFVSEMKMSWIDFVSNGNSRGRWKVSFDRLCGSSVLGLSMAEEFATPNYPARPSWPAPANGAATSSPSNTEDVCIWRISTSWEGQSTGAKLHFNLLNLVGPLDDMNDPVKAAATLPSGASGRPPVDCLRLYEGYNISLRQSAFNLTDMDAKTEPRLKLCSRKDLKHNSMTYTSSGSEITVITSGQLVAKFQVQPFENHCGGSFVMASGEFASPGYPQPYAADLDCHYFISGSPGSQVELKFRQFELAEGTPGDSCESTDFIEVRQLSSRIRAEIRMRNVIQYEHPTGGAPNASLSIVDFLGLSSKTSENLPIPLDDVNSTSVSVVEQAKLAKMSIANQTNYEARRKTLDRLLSLANLYFLFEESFPGVHSGWQLKGHNERLAIGLEQFYENSVLIGRYCGREAPRLARDLLHDEILVRFRTGSRPDLTTSTKERTVSKRQQPRGFLAGFRLNYGGTIRLPQDWPAKWAFVSSPAYPELGQQNSSIVWTFETESNALLEFQLVSLKLGSIHEDCQDTLSIYDGLQPFGGSPRLAKLCGHLSFKRLISTKMRPLWSAALAGRVSPSKLPINLAHEPLVRASLLRRFRSSSNVASLVWENVRGPGTFLVRYKKIAKKPEVATNETSSLELDLLEQPVGVEEALEEQINGDPFSMESALGEPDKSCSKVFRLSPLATLARSYNASETDAAQLMSPDWPEEPKVRAVECHWLMTASENTNIVLQIAPSYATTTSSKTQTPKGFWSQFEAMLSHYGTPKWRDEDHCLSSGKEKPGAPRNFVVVHDGASKLAPVLGRMCLPADATQMESTGRFMLVRYVHEAGTDPGQNQAVSSMDDSSSSRDAAQSRVSSSGLFRAQAHVGRCGGQYQVLYSVNIRYRSAGPDQSNYENNLSCLYYLFASSPDRKLAVMGRFLSELKLAATPTNANCTVGDYIEVRDLPIWRSASQDGPVFNHFAPEVAKSGRSLGRFCAGRPLSTANLESTGSALVIEFKTDASNTGEGFNLAVVSRDAQPGCSRKPVSLKSGEFLRLTSPEWPHSSSDKMNCKYSLSAPIDKSLKLTFIQLRRPSTRSPNGSIACQDSFNYVDDDEAPYSYKSLLELRGPLSGTKLRQRLRKIPCMRYAAYNEESLEDFAQSDSVPSDPLADDSSKKTTTDHRFADRITAEDYAKLLMQRTDSSLPIINTSSHSLLLEYEAESLLAGEGFLAVVRVADRLPERACGGTILPETGKNLLESASFGKLFAANESVEPPIYCEWKLQYSNSDTPFSEYLHNQQEWKKTQSTYSLVFQVFEIPQKGDNDPSSSSEFEEEFASWRESERISQECGLNWLEVTSKGFYTGHAMCGYFSSSPPKWLLLDPDMHSMVLMRTRNLQQLVYSRWPIDEGTETVTNGAETKSVQASQRRGSMWVQKKLFRGVRAYFHESLCPSIQRLADSSMVIKSHAGSLNQTADNSSYQPSICHWNVILSPGQYELIFKRLNLRKLNQNSPKPAATNKPIDEAGNQLSRNKDCYADPGEDPTAEPDHIELKLSNEPDSPVIGKFCAQNQLEAQKRKLLVNSSTDLSITFAAGIKQLQQGLDKFTTGSSGVVKDDVGSPFGFELLVTRVKNSSISDFCRRDNSFNIYHLIRNRELANSHYNPIKTNFKPNAMYAKNAHCIIDLSIEQNYKFNFTFVSFFDMEPSPNCKNDYIEINDLIPKADKSTKTTTRKPSATGKPTKRTTATRKPTTTTSKSSVRPQVNTTTTVAPSMATTKHPRDIFERMSLNLRENFDPVPIGRWCGRNLPKGSFVSKNNKVRLEFHSNEYAEGKGFVLEWSAIPANKDNGLPDDDDDQ